MSVARILHEVRTSCSRSGRRTIGRFAAEGTRLLERALAAGWPVEAAVLSERMRDSGRDREAALLAALREAGSELAVVDDSTFSDLVDGRTFGDIVGLCSLPEPAPVPALDASDILLVAVDIEDPGNAGALVRTALAAGARAMVAVGTTDVFHPKAVRTSMGSIFKLSVHERPSSSMALEGLGATTVGLVLGADGALGQIAPASGPRALVVGSESAGLSAEVVEQLDLGLEIPMATGVDSFSVNAAAAIGLWELRQR